MRDVGSIVLFRWSPSRYTIAARVLNTTMVVLAVCALLIVNSHLEAFYPTGFQFLAADGLLGSSLFYMLSGFGIQSSLMSREQGFGSYIRQRILRIYPGVILVVAVLLGIVGEAF